MVGAEEELKAQGNRKKNGLFSNVIGKSADDFDEFLALQQILEKRKELESLCRLDVKPGTWDKFIDFEAEMRVQRKKEGEASKRQIAATNRFILWGLITEMSIGGFVWLYFFTEYLRGLEWVLLCAAAAHAARISSVEFIFIRLNLTSDS